jgi:hypothetical protein
MIYDLPPTSPVQALSNQVFVFLKGQPGIGSSLGAEAPRIVFDTETSEFTWGPGNKFDAQANYFENKIVIYKTAPNLGFQLQSKLHNIKVQMAKIRKNRFLRQSEVETIHILIHEHFHFAQGQYWYATTPMQRHWEEGIVDAAAMDYIQPVIWKFFRDRVSGWEANPSYSCTDVIRTYSTIATKSRKWTDYAARVWRRDMLISTPDQRDAELTRIGVDPNSDCENTHGSIRIT